MKILIIGHPNAVLGFSLAGVHGKAVTTPDEVNQALDTALAAKDIGIILITQAVARLIQARVEDLKLHSTIPLVVEIPSPEGASPDERSLSEIVLRAIGIKL
jgi:V/A-type H+/Na+-transporting ATPase subunit F